MKRALIIVSVGAGTFLLVRCLAALAARSTEVPRDFPPFTTLPLLSGVVGAFLSAAAVHAVLQRSVQRPDRVFFFCAVAFLALSFGLPLRLSFTKSRRFAGVTPAAQMTLAMLHSIIAASAVTALTRIGD